MQQPPCEEAMMDTLMLTIYILVWPVISLAVLAVIVCATVRDIRDARREGRDVV